ncbi:MAG: hypothetical protein V1809_01700 [Planctomycetota bacterium]
MLRYFITGFGVGTGISFLYVKFGAWSWFQPQPVWAQILFLPGLFVGHNLYKLIHWHISRVDLAATICYWAGILTMGVVFGGIACLFGVMRRKR